MTPAEGTAPSPVTRADGPLKRAQLSARMLTARALVRGLAMTGDPVMRMLGRTSLEQPYPVYERLRARGPVSRHFSGLHFTAEHELCASVLRDSRFQVEPAVNHVGVDWNVRTGDAETLVHPTEQSILTMNPPDHARLRRLASPIFSARALRELTPRIEKLVEETLDEVGGRDEFDLITEVSSRIPLKVICDLFDLDEAEQSRFARWGSTLIGCLDGIRTGRERLAVRESVAEMTELFNGLLEKRRANPGQDVVSTLVTATAGGKDGAVESRDLVGLAGLILIAGFETTANLIGSAGLILLRDQEQRQWLLDDPARAGNMVEEALRLEPPIQMAMRKNTEPVTLGGTELPAGTQLVALIAGANRDPKVFDRPDVFDPERPNSRDHLAFSAGVHYCMGAALARAEAEAALSVLFQRMPELTLAGPVRYKTIRNIRGPASVPVRRKP